MGYYSTFPWGIPQIEADSIRVPHPCAGRRQVQALPLPLDLHVLGLPLAFILSQDQTLHCWILNNLWLTNHRSTPSILVLILYESYAFVISICSKNVTLTTRSFRSIGSLAWSFQCFNVCAFVSQSGCKYRNDYFFNASFSTKKFQKNSKFFFAPYLKRKGSTS